MGTFTLRLSAPGFTPAITDPITISAGGGPATTIALTAHRFVAGTGTTTVSAGVPLQRGQLMFANVSQVGLWQNGVEVSAYIAALEGRYDDGSVISLLVQRDAGAMTYGVPGTGYELRLTGSSVARAAYNASAVKQVPDAMWLPPPTHFRAKVAAVFGPLVPTSEVTGDLALIDAQYQDIHFDRWTGAGGNLGAVTGAEPTPNNAAYDKVEFYNSAYDRAKNCIRYAVRSGNAAMLEHGVRMASTDLIFFTKSNTGVVSGSPGYSTGEWNQHVLEFGPMGYWWTGYANYRAYIRWHASYVLIPFMAPPPPQGYDEGRITGRQIGVALILQLLGYGSDVVGGLTPAQWMDQLVQLSIDRQQTTGTTALGASCFGLMPENAPGTLNFQSNFMAQMRCYYMALYDEYRGAGGVSSTAIREAIRRQAVFMDTQWRPAFSCWRYWTDGTGVSDSEMRNLALMSATANMLAFNWFGQESLRTYVPSAVSMSVGWLTSGGDFRSAAFWALKAYNEDFYMWQYVLAKYLGA